MATFGKKGGGGGLVAYYCAVFMHPHSRPRPGLAISLSGAGGMLVCARCDSTWGMRRHFGCPVRGSRCVVVAGDGPEV